MNVLPSPGADSSRTVPPWPSMIWRTIPNPSPTPPALTLGPSGRTVERVEDPALFLGRDSHPPVADADFDPFIQLHEFDHDVLLPGRIFYSIVHEVHQCLFHGIGVDIQEDGVIGEDRSDDRPFPFRAVSPKPCRVLEKGPDGGSPGMIGPRPLLDPPEIQDIVEEPRKAAAFGCQEPEKILPLPFIRDRPAIPGSPKGPELS